MIHLKQKFQQFLTLTENQLKDLDKLLLSLSLILFFSASYIANYISTNANDAWDFFALILRFDFWLLIIALRNEIKNLIGNTTYTIIKWLIINNFIDRYLGYTTWSWNDSITILAVLLELLIHKKK